MKLATTAQMKEIDRIAIQERGIPSLELMERAASAVTEAVLARLAGQAQPRAAVLCGPGNNGGDGLAAARQLLARGVQVRTVLVGNTAHMTGDAREMAKRLEEAGGRVEPWPAGGWADCDCIVDALFGVGLNRTVGGDFAVAIAAINAAGVPVVSCDIPSGVNGDTGDILGTAVRAAQTVTFTCAKPGLLWGEGAACAGELTVADIGIPEELTPPAVLPGRYRHFKGKEYQVLGTARHSETEEPMVVYRPLYGERGLWVRPAAMWNETVERDGRTYLRFAYIGE